MKLPVLQNLNHISPTSLQEWQRCEYLFYLKRLAGLPWPTHQQGKPAAVGSAFDAFIKAEIGRYIGLEEMPEYHLEYMIEQNVDKIHREEVVPYAHKLFKSYLRQGCFNRLMDEGVAAIELKKKEEMISDGEHTPILFGLPDALMEDGTPLDFKVNGAFGAGQSPKPGYRSCYCKGIDKGQHAKFGLPLEAIDTNWATQLSIYTWIFSGLQPIREIPVAIEQVAIRDTTVCFASFRTHITVEFQRALWEKVYHCWVRAQEGDITEPTPNVRICHAYGQVCEVAEKCEAYQNVLGPNADPMLRALKG